MPKPTIWFDMDGVLATYNHSDYYGPNPIYKSKHYFASRPVDRKMVDLIKTLMSDDKSRIKLDKLGVVSKVQNDVPRFIEIVEDKQQWIRTHLPTPSTMSHGFITDYVTPVFIGETESKSKAIMARLNRPLTKLDILIDDYNVNLHDWVNAGGTAIKYGLGDKDSWQSYAFDDNLTTKQMLNFLRIITN